MIHQFLDFPIVHLIHGVSFDVQLHIKLFLDCINGFPT